MSTTSIKHEGLFAAHAADPDAVADRAGTIERASPDPGPFARWRRQVLETLAFLALIAIAQRRFGGEAGIPGLPHLYWLPVLLASCQYGVAGGMIAAAAASSAYFLELSPQSAAEDFYAYARGAALQPAIWLATALVVGGLRSLHIHQYGELSEQLAMSRRRAADLGDGLEQAVAEIGALERRIAEDASSVAAVSRSLARIDLSDRRSAAASLGELFHVGAGAGTFVVYLRGDDGYAPVCAAEKDAFHPTAGMPALPEAAIESMISGGARRGIDEGETSAFGPRRDVVVVPPLAVGAERLAAIVCDLHDPQEARRFRRRADDLARMFATVLSACPAAPPETRT